MRFCISLLLLVAIAYGCQKENSSDPIPSLELKGYDVLSDSFGKDSLILVHLSYSDGDGDLGLDDNNLEYPFGYSDPYFYNLFVDYYVEEGGVFVKKANPLSPTNDTIQFHERIQNITPSGKTKWVYGDISLRMPAFPFGLKPTRVKFQCRLVDRAINSSKVVLTPEITLNP